MSDPIDIVERLREALRKAESHPVPAGNAEPVIFVSPTALRAVLCELDELRRENFALAAGQCANAIGDEGGTPVCAEITRLRADFAALQHALVGDTGASAILTAQRLRAALAQPAAPGWQWVPVEPTADMRNAFHAVGDSAVLAFGNAGAHWKAMLAAAPQAPQPGGAGHTKE